MLEVGCSTTRALTGGTNPLHTTIMLPAGRKQYYWAMYYRDRVAKGVPENQIASLTRFNLMWRTEFPWISMRTASSPFTNCGLCDYLKMQVGRATDNGVRQALLMKLGHHYDHQAAQRLAASTFFTSSLRCPMSCSPSHGTKWIN